MWILHRTSAQGTAQTGRNLCHWSVRVPCVPGAAESPSSSQFGVNLVVSSRMILSIRAPWSLASSGCCGLECRISFQGLLRAPAQNRRSMSIFLDIRMPTPACFLGPLAWKTFSTPLVWDSICLCHWGVFLVCSKMLDPVYISNLLAFLLGNCVLWCWEILKKSDCCFLVLLLLKVELCLCGYLLIGLLMKITFLLFLGCSFPPYVGVFHLFSF